MKRGALHTEVIMFINDLHEHCGSGRLGSSRHVWVIVTDWRDKVCEGFAVFSAKLARALYAESRMPRERGVECVSEMVRCVRTP
jgi:hypothetical protein